MLSLPGERLFNFAIWAGILAVTGYVMGTLYERKQAMTTDIRESFSGLLLVLQHFMANEKLGVGENQRVVEASTRMAEAMGLGSDRVELLRSAVLLRDLSKLGITQRHSLQGRRYEPRRSGGEFPQASEEPMRAPKPPGNTLRRVIPIIVAQQIVQDQGARSVNVPVEAHILAVADAYQKLISGVDGKASVACPGRAGDCGGSGPEVPRGRCGRLHKSPGARKLRVRELKITGAKS